MDKIRLRVSQAEAQGDDQSIHQAITLEDRTLRNATQNAMAMSVWMLQDDSNRRICCGITLLMQPLLDWHTKQNKDLRGAEQTLTWLMEQCCNNGILGHVSSMWSKFTDNDFLVKSGFLGTSTWGLVGDEEEGMEDELAELFGHFGCILAFMRSKRAAWYLKNWPKPLVRALAGVDEAVKVTTEFKNKVALWRRFCAAPNPTALALVYQKRGLMNTTPVKQYIAALESVPMSMQILSLGTKGILDVQVRCGELVLNAFQSVFAKVCLRLGWLVGGGLVLSVFCL